MPATLKDVSLLAGVSLTTVSHVVNGTRAVSAAARARVEEAVRLTGYTPNSVARSLKLSSTRIIGLAIQDIRNPHFTEVMHALEAEAREHGFTILLSDVGDNPELERGAMRALRERGLSVPNDIALVACDDFEWANLFHPRLTMVAQPCLAIGEHAIKLPLDRIHTPDLPPRHVRLPAERHHPLTNSAVRLKG
jgi:DNA-binding LacI/PurR family transcriptional regulator